MRISKWASLPAALPTRSKPSAHQIISLPSPTGRTGSLSRQCFKQKLSHFSSLFVCRCFAIAKKGTASPVVSGHLTRYKCCSNPPPPWFQIPLLLDRCAAPPVGFLFCYLFIKKSTTAEIKVSAAQNKQIWDICAVPPISHPPALITQWVCDAAVILMMTNCHESLFFFFLYLWTRNNEIQQQGEKKKPKQRHCSGFGSDFTGEQWPRSPPPSPLIAVLWHRRGQQGRRC